MVLVKIRSVLILWTIALTTMVFCDVLDDSDEDYRQLVYYAKLASVAYCLKKGLQPGLLGDEQTRCPKTMCQEDEYKHIKLIKTFDFNDWGDVGSGFYAIDKEQKEIILSFRGTSSRLDWLSDLDIMPVKYEPLINLQPFQKVEIECHNCKVHRGFYKFLVKNCVSIIEETKQLKEKHPEYRLVILGHSLGAALTILAGIEFQLMGYHPLIIAYACPKVGNGAFMQFADKLFETSELADEIDSKHKFTKGFVRLSHTNDLVTQLPPSPVFKHGGYKYHIEKKLLPHRASDIERRGIKDNEEHSDVTDMTFGKLFSNTRSKYAHSHYLTRMTGCDDNKL